MVLRYKRYSGRLNRELHNAIVWSKKALEVNKFGKGFLWEHTTSENHYWNIVEALELISKLRKNLVEWGNFTLSEVKESFKND